MAGLFQVLWGDDDGEFRTAEPLTGTDGEPLIVSAPKSEEGYDSDLERICTRPVAVDWDGDGDLDLITGNFGGTFSLFRGEGEGRFQPTSEQLLVEGDVLRIDGYHSDPFCVDWDGDGDLDLLSGSTAGGVQISKNTAGPGKLPKLSAFQPLISPGEKDGAGEMLDVSELTAPTRSTRIWVDDVNGDGKLDVLMGDMTTLCEPADGLSDEECRKREAAWTKKMEDISKKLNAIAQAAQTETADDSDADKSENSGDGEPAESEVVDAEVEIDQAELYTELNKLYQSRSEFIKEDRTGFVWLYLQK